MTAGRAREEAERTLEKMLGYNTFLPSPWRADLEALYTRAIAAALEVVEGHRCCDDLHNLERHPMDCACLHHTQECAAAIAAELKRLL